MTASSTAPIVASPEHRIGVASTHAKAILFGEHTVVAGHPAIALPLRAIRATASARFVAAPRRGAPSSTLESVLYTGPFSEMPAALRPVQAALEAALVHVGLRGSGVAIRIDSDIPASRGLGSSAAVSAAVIKAVADLAGKRLDPLAHHALTQTAERVAHGTPSGLDAYAVTAAHAIWFEGGRVQHLPVRHLPIFVLADTGIESGTREAVEAVRHLRERDGSTIDAIFERLASIATAAAGYLLHGAQERLGAAMYDAHSLLAELTVSAPALDRLVAAARTAGALGAKLTGSGRGGCIIALAENASAAEHVRRALASAGARATWVVAPEERP